MKISYRVSQADYEAILLLTLRRAERTPIRIISLMVMTLGQTAWVIYMLFTAGFDPRQRLIVCLCSAALTLINVIYRILRPFRARLGFKNVAASGEIVPDYWKLHTLTVKEGKITLTFGSVRLELQCGDVQPSQEDGMLMLRCNDKLFDVVPGPAFASDEQREALLAALSAPPAPREPEPLPENAEYTLRWETDGKGFIDQQTRCYRCVYFRRTFLKPYPIAKLLGGLYMLYYAIFEAGFVSGMLLAVFVLLLNMPVIIAATPAARPYLLQRLPSLDVPGDRPMDMAVCVTRDSIYTSVNGVIHTAAMKDLDLCCKSAGLALAYAGAFPAAAIPQSAFESREAMDKFLAYVNARAMICR